MKFSDYRTITQAQAGIYKTDDAVYIYDTGLFYRYEPSSTANADGLLVLSVTAGGRLIANMNYNPSLKYERITSDQALTAGVQLTVTMNNKVHDDFGTTYSGSTWTVPFTGVWLIGANIGFTLIDDTFRYFGRIYDITNSKERCASIGMSSAANQDTRTNCSAIITMSKNNTMRIEALTGSTGSSVLANTAGADLTFFYAVLLKPTLKTEYET